MLQTFKNGQGSIILRAKLLDSSSTTGAGLTGLSSASSGLIISTIADVEATATAYTVAGSTVESITTLGTYAAPTATKCRFKEVDATNHKGIYEFQFADARFAVASAKSILISVLGATNLQQADFVVQLQSDDPYVAKPSNSNLLSIDGSGRIDVIKVAGTTQTAGDIIGDTNDIQARLPAALVSGRMDSSVGAMAANVLTATAIAADAITDAKVASDVTIASVTGAVGSVTAMVNANVMNWLNNPVTTPFTAGIPLVDTRFIVSLDTAQAGGATSITLAASESAVTDFYKGMQVFLRAGTGVGQSRVITGYNGTTKVATVSPAWATNPASGTEYMIVPAAADVQGWGGVAPNALIAGRMDSSVGAMAADTLTASAVAADAVTEIQSGLSTLTAAGVRSAVGLASANLDSQLTAIDDLIDSEVAAIKFVTDKIDPMIESAPGSPAVNRFTTQALEAVWDEILIDHLTAGTTGNALNAAGAAGDPWSTSLPGAYGAGTAGKIIGDNINATVSSRASQTSVDTIDDFVDSEVGAIKAKTDQLTFTVVNQVDVNVVDWKGATAPAMTGDAFARLGAPAGASISADVAGVQSDTNDIQTRLPAALVSGRIDASVGAMAANVLTAAATATDFGAEISDAVWDEAIAGHLAAGSTGKALNDATSAGNPWNSVLEGSLTAGDLLRVNAGIAAGQTDITDLGGGNATVVFRNITDTGDIVTATMTGSERTSVTVTP